MVRYAAPNSQDIFSGEREVMFRCGNWCYIGKVVIDRDQDGRTSEE